MEVLQSVPHLKISSDLLKVRFGENCSMANCKGVCCKGGVWADLAERENILRHVEVVHKYMDPEQEHDPNRWFEFDSVEDADFPSGRCVGTQVVNNGCVFLDKNKLCVLQKAEMGEKNSALQLKPFYCKAFPIAIQHGEVVYDDYMKDTQPQCCSPAPDGPKDVFAVCEWELEVVVGKEGVEELKRAPRS